MADPAGDRKHPRPIEYPTSYGKPMAESDLHRDLMIYVIEALRSFFDTRPDVYVSGNNFIYYVEGDPRRCVSPDAYVVFGVPMSPRDRYCSWEEGGRLPNVVFEFTSRKTRQEDVRVKRPRYEQELRVPEYFLFDPKGDCLSPRLQGFRLVAGRYVPLELVDGRLHSEQLGLDLVQEKSRLRLFDPTRREPLLTPHEREQARRVAEEARWNAEEAHRSAEEARRSAEEALRSSNEARRAAEEERDASDEARKAAERELARMKAELEELRRRAE